MGEIWYEVEWGVVKSFTVMRETEQCVFVHDAYSVKPRRKMKGRNMFRTLSEANSYNLERLQSNVAGLKERLARAERDLAQFSSNRLRRQPDREQSQSNHR